MRNYRLKEQSSYYLNDGVRVIQRRYDCGLTTRELDCSNAEWYNKLINKKRNEKTNTEATHPSCVPSHRAKY